MEVIKNLSDLELVGAIRQGRAMENAIKFIYREHFDSLCRYVENNNGSRQDAEDVFQEVLVSFIGLVQEDKFRGDSTVKTFLYSMTRNTWLNELKKRGRNEQREMKYEKTKDEQNMDVNHLIAGREATQQVLRVVEQLGEGCKKILLLFYYENLSMKEILEATDYENEQVVRNKKYKCLKQLEQMISNDPTLKQNMKSLLHG